MLTHPALMTREARPPLLKRQHLLAIDDISSLEAIRILDLAERYVEVSRQTDKRQLVLQGRTQVNLFFEASTRTQSSFEIAGKRLGADVMNMAVANSAVSKGETLLDTAMTINAMQPDFLVVRHQSSGAAELLAQKVSCAVINAGDGQHEHPTQALLDALTIRHALGLPRGSDLNGLKVTICGDILHSRVARSNILSLTALGADVTVCAPPALMPSEIAAMGVTPSHDFDAALEGADIVMMLRLQQERMSGQFIPSPREYRHLYGLTLDRFAKLPPHVFVMHPGPMNRGIEIDSQVADHPARSLVTRQVESGVAIRMACLDVLTRRARGVPGWAAAEGAAA